MAKKGRTRVPQLSKLSIAILENLVEKVIGEDAIDEIKAPLEENELREAITASLGKAEERFTETFENEDLRKALLDLPLADLPSVNKAVRKFYEQPTDSGLEKILVKQLQKDYPTLKANPERIETAINAYIGALIEELAVAKEDFRAKAAALATIRMKKDTERIAEGVEKLVGLEKGKIDSGEMSLQALHQLPAPPADFTGRQAELGELLEKITEGGVSISGVQGMGGVGKTALALVLADKLKGDYPDAQFYLNLKGADEQEPLAPAEVMRHIIRGYHPTAQLPEKESELAAIYHSVLHGQRALLLLDNARNATQVKPLIPPPGCGLLVTSRQKFTLPGLYAKDLDRMDKDEACELLLKIAPRIGEHTGKIAKLCDYLPLALRVAASALAERADLDVAAYVQRLAQAERRLAMLPGLERSLSLSYALLGEELQARWRTLAVFPDTFDSLAAMAIWNGSDKFQKWVEEGIFEGEFEKAQSILSQLVQYSLLGWEPGGRYRLHDLARLYAQEQLSDTERAEYELRHAEHYKTVLSAADERFLEGGAGVLQGLGLYDREAAHIQAGQGWAAGNADQDEKAAQLADAYPDAGVYVLALRLHPREWIAWLQSGLAAARQLGERAAEGVHLGNLGLAYAALGETKKAIDIYEQRLEIAREIGDRHGEGNALGNLGIAYKNLGETGKAIEYYEQRLVIAREIGDRRGEGNGLWNMCLELEQLGQREEAVQQAAAALEIFEQIGDPNSEMVRRQLAAWRGE